MVPSGNLHAEVGAKSKTESQELCKRRREREISPSSLRRSGLNLHKNLMNPTSLEYLNRQRIIPKLRWWTLGAMIYILFCFSSFCKYVCVCFSVWFCLYSFAFTICPRVLFVKYFFLVVFFFGIFCIFSIVFSTCYRWWVCFLVWLLSSFFFYLFFITLKFFIFNNYFLF